MSDLFEEAKHDYKYHRNIELFKRILPLATILTIILIIIISLRNWYQSRQVAFKEQRTALLIDAIFDEEKTGKSAIDILSTLAEEEDGVAHIAELNKIARLYKENDGAKILSLLKEIIENRKDKLFVNYAKINYVSILLDKPSLEEVDIKNIENYLVSIDKTQPLYNNSRVIHALFYLKIDNINSASEIINSLLEEEISDSIRGQAEAVQSYIRKKRG